jgi:hypothetical protein
MRLRATTLMNARYAIFFEVVGHDHSEFDYLGRVFPTPEEAYEFMAFDLIVKQKDEMIKSPSPYLVP